MSRVLPLFLNSGLQNWIPRCQERSGGLRIRHLGRKAAYAVVPVAFTLKRYYANFHTPLTIGHQSILLFATLNKKAIQLPITKRKRTVSTEEVGHNTRTLRSTAKRAGGSVDVIIPVYNSKRFLRRCLDSVLGQSHTQIEVIAVDDGSCDRSLSILEDYAARDHRLIVLTQNNRGGRSSTQPSFGRSPRRLGVLRGQRRLHTS